MSSTYALICLSHDPAIVTDHEFYSPADALEALALGAHQHPLCDVLIGRWSGALVELGCPPTGRPHHPGSHRDAQWVHAGWLRLLNAFTEEQATEARLWQCWTKRRADVLRSHL